MNLLITGLVIWVMVHFIPSLMPGLKQSIATKFGDNIYKLLFTASMLVALGLIIFGWLESIPEHVYTLPFATKPLTIGLMFVSIILFGAAQYPTRIKNLIRHPQLMAVTIWSIAHLISNGDSRSIVLFGTLGIWALLEMVLINRREGAWKKIEAPPMFREVRGLLISVVIFVVIFYIHV
jgi:uncharacterized membrane protein